MTPGVMPVLDMRAIRYPFLPHAAQNTHGVGMRRRRVVKQGIGIDCGNLLYYFFRQPLHKTGIHVAYEYLYLLSEGNIPLLGPNVVAGTVTLPIRLPDVVFGKLLSHFSQSLSCAVKAHLHPCQAKLPVIHEESLPQVKSNTRNRQFLQLPDAFIM